jgi:hypothetical protein
MASPYCPASTGDRISTASTPAGTRASSAYRGGRSDHWIKVKNRKHPAFSRVADEF